MIDQLTAMLQGGALSHSAFLPTSRYHNVATKTMEKAKQYMASEIHYILLFIK